MNILMKKQNNWRLSIKLNDRLPYKPHSQGIVAIIEIIYKTISVGLIIKKIKYKNKFNLNESLEEIIVILIIIYTG